MHGDGLNTNAIMTRQARNDRDATRFHRLIHLFEARCSFLRWVSDRFEQSLRSEVPEEGLTEALLVLLKPLWRFAVVVQEEKERKEQAKRKDPKSRHRPSKALLELREPINEELVLKQGSAVFA
jgi:hypothetical protein